MSPGPASAALWPVDQPGCRIATVNRESLVRVDGNQYSVPVGHLGQAVDVRILRDVIRLSRDGVLLAEHARLAGT